MPVGPELHTFFDNFHVGVSSSIDHVIQNVVREFSQIQRPLSPSSPSCLLQDVGDFLVTVLRTLSHIVKIIVRETHIPQHIKRRLSVQAEEHDLTDLSEAKYMDKKYDALLYDMRCVPTSNHAREH